MIRHILTMLWNRRKSNFLMLIEIVVSFFILFAVLTFVTENIRKFNTPLGFDTEQLWVVSTIYDEEIDSADLAEMRLSLRQQILDLPEVEHVSFSNWITPFSGSMWSTGGDDNGFEFWTALSFTDEDYDETMNMNVTEGRWFEENDLLGKYPCIVVNNKFREKYFEDRSIVDSLIIIDDTEYKIVGVVDHYKYRGEFDNEYEMSIMQQQVTDREATEIFVRVSSGTDHGFSERLYETVVDVTKRTDFNLEYLESVRKRHSRGTWIPVVALLSISGFLILNVVLGLFGVLWYNINKRRGEIGLRQAIGATQASIIGQFIGEVMLVVFAGVLLGVIFAVQFPLLKVIDIDPSNFYIAILIAVGIIISLVLVCTFYPSYQASLIRPAVALHEE